MKDEQGWATLAHPSAFILYLFLLTILGNHIDNIDEIVVASGAIESSALRVENPRGNVAGFEAAGEAEGLKHKHPEAEVIFHDRLGDWEAELGIIITYKDVTPGPLGLDMACSSGGIVGTELD